MYEVLLKLYYELDYRKFNIEDLKEIKGLLNQYNKQVQEVKIKNLSITKRGVSNGTNKNK